MEVVRKAWENVRPDVREDAMRTLQCCGFDADDYMNTWQDREDNVILSNYVTNFIKFLQTDTSGWCEREGIPVPSEKTQRNFEYKYCKTKVRRKYFSTYVQHIFQIEENIDMVVEKTGGVSLFFSFGQMFGVWLAIRYRNQRNPAGPDPRAFGSD